MKTNVHTLQNLLTFYRENLFLHYCMKVVVVGEGGEGGGKL